MKPWVNVKMVRNISKRFAIITVFFITQIMIGFLIFYDTLLLLIVSLLPACVSLMYLRSTLVNQKELTNESESKLHTPFAFFGIMIMSQVSIPIILIFYYSQPFGWIIYTIITSSVFTLTSMMTIFFIPLVLYQEGLKSTVKTYVPNEPVSVIVPAFNEERYIRKILNSLNEDDYQNKEVIVVDDGSTDKTYSIAREHKRYFPSGRFSVLRKQNGGKSSALNYGIRFARGDIIIIVDADSIIDRGTIKEIVRKFQDPRVIGVAGDCSVSNRVNFLTNCQALEYIISMNVFRRAFGLLGFVLIIPGPLGAFRRDAVLSRGLCDKDTLTEDFDVTLKLLKSGRKVAEASSKSYTIAPTTVADLYRQKSRWTMGAIQTLMKHKDILSNTKHDIIRIFLYPIKLLSLLVMPIFDVVLIGFTVQAIATNTFIFPLIWFGLFVYFYSLLAIVAVTLQKHKDSKLLWYVPFMSFVYRQIIDFIIVRTLILAVFQKYLKGSNTTEKSGFPLGFSKYWSGTNQIKL